MYLCCLLRLCVCLFLVCFVCRCCDPLFGAFLLFFCCGFGFCCCLFFGVLSPPSPLPVSVDLGDVLWSSEFSCWSLRPGIWLYLATARLSGPGLEFGRVFFHLITFHGNKRLGPVWDLPGVPLLSWPPIGWSMTLSWSPLELLVPASPTLAAFFSLCANLQFSCNWTVVLVVQLVSRHSCVADGRPVVVRLPAGPRVRLKTVDSPKGNGLGPKKAVSCNWTGWVHAQGQRGFWTRNFRETGAKRALIWIERN